MRLELPVDMALGTVALGWHRQCYVEQSHRLIIVHRDSPAILSAILRCPERWPPKSAVMLDRRTAERRRRDEAAPVDRRQGERRTPPDPFLAQHGFIVVYVDDLPLGAIPLDAVPTPA